MPTLCASPAHESVFCHTEATGHILPLSIAGTLTFSSIHTFPVNQGRSSTSCVIRSEGTWSQAPQIRTFPCAGAGEFFLSDACSALRMPPTASTEQILLLTSNLFTYYYIRSTFPPDGRSDTVSFCAFRINQGALRLVA